MLLVLELPREKTTAILGVLRSDERSRTLAEWLMEVREDPLILELLLEELRRLGRRQLTNWQGR